MNIFSYYITTHFITNNKDYNSYHNPHSVYQTYPNSNNNNNKNFHIPYVSQVTPRVLDQQRTTCKMKIIHSFIWKINSNHAHSKS